MTLLNKILDSRFLPLAMDLAIPVLTYTTCSIVDASLENISFTDALKQPFSLIKAGCYGTMIGYFAASLNSSRNR